MSLGYIICSRARRTVQGGSKPTKEKRQAINIGEGVLCPGQGLLRVIRLLLCTATRNIPQLYVLDGLFRLQVSALCLTSVPV